MAVVEMTLGIILIWKVGEWKQKGCTCCWWKTQYEPCYVHFLSLPSHEASCTFWDEASYTFWDEDSCTFWDEDSCTFWYL